MRTFGLTLRELRTLRNLRTPDRIQRFLDGEIGYDFKGTACRSPRRVLRDRLAQCLDGALFAAAALRVNGFPPLLLDLEAERDDDHVLAIFKIGGHWGAIAKSNYAGLRFREPVYRSLRELVMSYFEHYFNLSAEKTLRRYSRPVNLSRFDDLPWMTAETDLWAISDHLFRIRHVNVLSNGLARRLSPVDDRLFAAGLVGRVGSRRT
jgi:hypothetical protein